jgi:hypothetical protein
MPTQFFNYNTIWGSGYDADTYESWYYVGGQFAQRYNNVRYCTDISYTQFERHTMRLEKNGTKLYGYRDDVQMAGSGSTCTTKLTDGIFYLLKSGTDIGKNKIYKVKLTKGSTLERYYVPCYRKSDNVIGLYDLVNNTFTTNAGTGTFDKGADITLPTPDFPKEIQTVKGYNLFDKATCLFTDKKRYNDSGAIVTDNDSSYSDFIVVEPNETYTIQNLNGLTNKTVRVTLFNKDKTFIKRTPSEGTNNITITTDSDTHYLSIQGRDLANMNIDTIQLTKGTTTKPYLPYGAIGINNETPNRLLKSGLSTPVNDSNYWSSVSSQFTPLSNGWGRVYCNNTTTSTIYVNYITNISGAKLKPNTNYTIYFEFDNVAEDNNCGITFNQNRAFEAYKTTSITGITESNIKNGNVIAVSATTRDVLGSDVTTSLRSFTTVSSNRKASFDIRIMIVEGTHTVQEYSYVQYQESITYIDLKGNELCKIGDIEDTLDITTGVLTKRINKIVLDGTESWDTWDAAGDYKGFYLYKYDAIRPNLENEYQDRVKCDLFTQVATREEIRYGQNEGIKMCGANGDPYIAIGISKSRLSSIDLAGFKQWLSTHKTTLYYELATPQQIQLSPQTIPLFENINNIYLESEIDPDGIYLKYYTNSEINNSVKEANKNFAQKSKTTAYYTTTITSVLPDASAEWHDNITSSTDFYIWQKFVTTYENGAAATESTPSCIYTPARRITSSSTQYCD